MRIFVVPAQFTTRCLACAQFPVVAMPSKDEISSLSLAIRGSEASWHERVTHNAKLKHSINNKARPMSDSIHIKFPDGSTKDVPKGTTSLEIAKDISPRLADA